MHSWFSGGKSLRTVWWQTPRVCGEANAPPSSAAQGWSCSRLQCSASVCGVGRSVKALFLYSNVRLSLAEWGTWVLTCVRSLTPLRAPESFVPRWTKVWFLDQKRQQPLGACREGRPILICWIRICVFKTSLGDFCAQWCEKHWCAETLHLRSVTPVTNWSGGAPPRPAESGPLETVMHASYTSVKLEEKNKTILRDESEKQKESDERAWEFYFP